MTVQQTKNDIILIECV